MPDTKQPARLNREYVIFHTSDRDRVTRWRAQCVAADKSFVAVRIAERRAEVAFDARTLRTPLSEVALARIRTAFECSGRASWVVPGDDLTLCFVNSAKAAHRLARYVLDLVQRDRQPG